MTRYFLLATFLLGCSDPHGTAPDAAGQEIDAPIAIDAGPTSTDAGADMTLLSMQGVYGDFGHKTLPVDAIAYDVRWELWADGATKRRWLILSPGSAPIDNTDQDHWVLPVGARLVKEFTRGGTLVETRIVERTSAATYSLRTYVWNAAQTEAVLDTDGATDVNGTPHDVPTAAQCMSCHSGEAGRALGFSAVQLPAATLAMLSSTGKLKNPITTAFGPTGAATSIAAVGYLHANCGHCHNPNGIAGTINNQTLRLDATAKPVEMEPGWLTTVNVAVQGNGLGATLRIAPMQPTNSAVVKRMSVRGAGQMPLIATETVDQNGVDAVVTWVGTLQ